MRSEKIQREYTPLYKQFQIFDKSAFLVFPFFSHIYTFSAILSLALRDLGFRSISASSGTITLLLTGRRGAFIRPKKSCSARPSTLPVFMKFLTMRSSNEWYVRTTNRPPCGSNSTDCSNNRRRLSISWFTSIRKA